MEVLVQVDPATVIAIADEHLGTGTSLQMPPPPRCLGRGDRLRHERQLRSHRQQPTKLLWTRRRSVVVAGGERRPGLNSREQRARRHDSGRDRNGTRRVGLRGQRRVFLDHETAELLREHRKAQLRLRLKAGDAWQDNDLVFCQDDGRPWNLDHVSKRFKKLAALAGVPVICLHEGGRTLATRSCRTRAWTRSCGCARSDTPTSRSTTATRTRSSRRTWRPPSRRQRWCERRGKQHDRD